MDTWKYIPGNGFNDRKMKKIRDCFPGTESRIHWQYLVFLHRCNFNGRIDADDTEACLKMLQEPMYNEAAFIAMETPLLEKLVSLRSELEEKNHGKYQMHCCRWEYVGYQMERTRESKSRGAAKANEYFAAAWALP
jgi:hypothetical protein